MVGAYDVEAGRPEDLGVVVLGADGSVQSANARACALLNAASADRLGEKLEAIRRQLPGGQFVDGSSAGLCVDTPEFGRLGLRSFAVGQNGEGRVLLMRDERLASSHEAILRQASAHRCFTFLARDWAHDVKGMLHVIKINHALLARALQREDGALSAKTLEAIPREVDRIDRMLDLALGTRKEEDASDFDMNVVCDRLVRMIAGRAARQRVEVAYEPSTGPVEVHGVQGMIEGALLNLLVNALEAMPEQGRLVVGVSAGSTVRVRICDTGHGMHELDGTRLPQFVSEPSRTGIGLHVTRTVLEAHGGRIECSASAPRGTCFLVDLPPAPTGRLGHGPRTYR